MNFDANRKPDKRSVIACLSSEQRQTLETWLFDENRTYADVIQLAGEHWQVKIKDMALSRFYHGRRRDRALKRIARTASEANELIAEFKKYPDETYDVLIKMVGQIAFNRVVDPEKGLDTETIKDFTRLLIAARKEERESKKLSFDRDKWEFDAASACRAQYAEIKAVTEDASIDEEAKILAIRRRLFGTNLPE